MVEKIPAFAGHRLASPGWWLLVSVGGLLAGGWLCLLAQTSGTTQTVASVVTTNTIVQPAAVPAQTNGVAQTTSGTTNNLSQIIANDPAFQRFTNLIEHSLFTPTSPSSTGGSGTDVPAFVGGLRVTGFFIVGTNVQASIEDRNEADKKFFVRVGDTIGDTEIKVTAFDLPGRALLLSKGQEQGRLEYESEAAPAPPPPGAAGAQRPGTPGMMPPGGPPGGPPGSRGGFSQPPTPQGASSAGSSSMGTTRAQNRRQTIDRLRQMLQNTTDPAAQQRLKSYIQLLEKANSEER